MHPRHATLCSINTKLLVPVYISFYKEAQKMYLCSFPCRKSPPFFPSLVSLWTSCRTAVIWELTWVTTSITGSAAAPRLLLTSPRQQARLLISCYSASSAATWPHAATAPSSTCNSPWICSTRDNCVWREETIWWCLSPCQRSEHWNVTY